MQVLSDSFNEELPAIGYRVKNTLTLYSRSDIVDNSIDVFGCEEVSDFSRRE